MDEIAAASGELIVFIDEMHTVVGAGGGGEGGMDAGNILKPRLARGELHLVGATTLKEYRTIEKDPALERRFQPVTVGEPSIEDAVLILHGLQARVRGAPRRELHRRRAARRRRASATLPHRPRAARQGDRPDRPGRRAAAPAARRAASTCRGAHRRAWPSSRPTRTRPSAPSSYEEASAHPRPDRGTCRPQLDRAEPATDAPRPTAAAPRRPPIVDEAEIAAVICPRHRHSGEPAHRERARAPRRASRTSCTRA